MQRLFLSEKNTPRGIRIPVASVKGMCPRPLDDGGVFLTFTKIPSQLRVCQHFKKTLLNLVMTLCLTTKFKPTRVRDSLKQALREGLLRKPSLKAKK